MDLDELRQKIDECDRRLVELLNERAKVVLQIGEWKRQQGRPIYDASREQAVIEKISKANKGPLPDRCLHAIYRELMSASIALEKPTTVCFLGPDGTFSHVAARAKFGESVNYLPVRGVDAIFHDVGRGDADYGVVPIENSTEGGIADTLEMFMDSDLKVCAEIILPIHHHLIGGCPVAQVKRVYSKRQVFGQCKRWIADNLAHGEPVGVSSTSEAARRASEAPDDSAAIAHEGAAGLYGLKVLARAIEDWTHNMTRFLVITREDVGRPTGKDKTSIMCWIKDEVGALYGVLLPFKDSGINLTKIESFPSRRRPWEYLFFVDFEGHVRDDPVRHAIDNAKVLCKELKILGSFPVSPPVAD